MLERKRFLYNYLITVGSKVNRSATQNGARFKIATELAPVLHQTLGQKKLFYQPDFSCSFHKSLMLIQILNEQKGFLLHGGLL